ncbi:MAG TPA: carboxynorspermidine decarboxylase [Fibrobacteria bacterium]|nr:carboxynorspermidine decarboxylase [Fibrobacteria bacterium]
MTYPTIGTDFAKVPSPCYVMEEARLRANLALLKRVADEADVKIICALKGFSFWRAFPLVRQYLVGATASSLNEALLASQELGGELHVYAPAYADDEIGQILDLACHVSFNSFSQWERFKGQVLSHPGKPSPGLRVNPECSQVATDLYNPCAPFSRLGIVRSAFREDLLEGIEGLHVHALCEQDSDALEALMESFEEKFGQFLPNMKWVNFGGGHHITRADYDVDRLIRVLKGFKSRHPHLEVVLEPGEAVGWRTGELVATVLDIVHNGMDLAVLDVSVSAHMPDCLEMPYRPGILDADEPGVKPHTYRLGGGTCLAGDVLGDYSFDEPLQVGDKIVLLDMIHYTMVKTSFFNGVKHPSIATWKEDGTLQTHRVFHYEQFKNKLG